MKQRADRLSWLRPLYVLLTRTSVQLSLAAVLIVGTAWQAWEYADRRQLAWMCFIAGLFACVGLSVVVELALGRFDPKRGP